MTSIDSLFRQLLVPVVLLLKPGLQSSDEEEVSNISVVEASAPPSQQNALHSMHVSSIHDMHSIQFET